MNDHKRDPSGDKKDHPAAKGVGAVVGGVGGGVAGGVAAGAAVGGMTGPVGAAVGAAVGAVVGAVAGKGIAKAADPAQEEAYWRDNYSTRPYVDRESRFDDYGPAYRYGVDSYSKYPNRSFDEVEPELGRDWNNSRSGSSLEWERAKHASRDAWHRVERAVPGDADGDGR